jgi:HAD superfamily hydrolase (TIGR01490 family)
MSSIIRMGTISSDKSGENIVFFDLDNTLLNGNSSKLLIRLAHKKQMIRFTVILKALWLSFLFKFNLKDTERIISAMVKWLEGVPVSVITALASEVFKERMSKLISRDAKSVVGIHKNHKARLVILSSALEPVCRPVADYFEIDDVLCTELEVKGEYYTGKPSGKLCFGGEKLVRLKQFCNLNQFKIDNAWYYGDSFSDLPVLEAVGHPVCVNPDKQLKKTAIKNGWKIYYWNI